MRSRRPPVRPRPPGLSPLRCPSAICAVVGAAQDLNDDGMYLFLRESNYGWYLMTFDKIGGDEDHDKRTAVEELLTKRGRAPEDSWWRWGVAVAWAIWFCLVVLDLHDPDGFTAFWIVLALLVLIAFTVEERTSRIGILILCLLGWLIMASTNVENGFWNGHPLWGLPQHASAIVEDCGNATDCAPVNEIFTAKRRSGR